MLHVVVVEIVDQGSADGRKPSFEGRMRTPLHQARQLIANIGQCIAQYMMTIEVKPSDVVFWRIPPVLFNALGTRLEQGNEIRFIDDVFFAPEQSKEFIRV
jgi:hypothetical protein